MMHYSYDAAGLLCIVSYRCSFTNIFRGKEQLPIFSKPQHPVPTHNQFQAPTHVMMLSPFRTQDITALWICSLFLVRQHHLLCDRWSSFKKDKRTIILRALGKEFSGGTNE